MFKSHIEEFTKLEHQLVFLFHHPENEQVKKSIEILILNIINNIDEEFILNNKTIFYNLWLVLETYYRDKCEPLIPDSDFDIFESKIKIIIDPLGIENNTEGRLSLWKHKEIITKGE